jgi:predicted RNA-binding protein with RPS1 domain
MVDEKNTDEVPAEDPVAEKPLDKNEILNVDEPDIEAVSAGEDQDDEPFDRGQDGGHYQRSDRSRHEPSFEEKMRSFKKQSEERLLHIKRSRENKIGKKKTR